VSIMALLMLSSPSTGSTVLHVVACVLILVRMPLTLVVLWVILMCRCVLFHSRVSLRASGRAVASARPLTRQGLGRQHGSSGLSVGAVS
jgi:hypothetical protein